MKTTKRTRPKQAIAIRNASIEWFVPRKLPAQRAYMVGWNTAAFGRPFAEAIAILRDVHRDTAQTIKSARRGFDAGKAATK